MLCQMCAILESGAKHSLVWEWPLVGLSDPDARPDVQWSPAEASAVVAWHREAVALESAKMHLMLLTGKTTPKVKNELPSADDDNFQKQIRASWWQAARTGRQGREGQRRRSLLRPGRDLHDAGPARPRDRSHSFSRHQNGWPMLYFALLSSLLLGDGVHETLSARRSPHLASPDVSQSTPSHPLQPRRAEIAALVSWCLVRLSNGGKDPLDKTALSLFACCGAALAIRLDRMAVSGDMRGCSRALFLAVLNGTSISGPEPVNFSIGRIPSESTAKDIISARISFPTRDAIVPRLDRLPRGSRRAW